MEKGTPRTEDQCSERVSRPRTLGSPPSLMTWPMWQCVVVGLYTVGVCADQVLQRILQ